MMETIGQKLLDALKLYGVKVLFALGILLVGWFVARMIHQALKNLMRKAHLDDTLVTFLASLSHCRGHEFCQGFTRWVKSACRRLVRGGSVRRGWQWAWRCKGRSPISLRDSDWFCSKPSGGA